VNGRLVCYVLLGGEQHIRLWKGCVCSTEIRFVTYRPAAQSGQRDGFFTRKRATTQRSNRTHKCARAIDQHLDRMRHQRDHIPSQINIMLGLLDALTFWIIALRFSQPVVCDPRYHAYVDIAILVLSSAQMWHTYFGGTGEYYRLLLESIY